LTATHQRQSLLQLAIMHSAAARHLRTNSSACSPTHSGHSRRRQGRQIRPQLHAAVGPAGAGNGKHQRLKQHAVALAGAHNLQRRRRHGARAAAGSAPLAPRHARSGAGRETAGETAQTINQQRKMQERVVIRVNVRCSEQKMVGSRVGSDKITRAEQRAAPAAPRALRARCADEFLTSSELSASPTLSFFRRSAASGFKAAAIALMDRSAAYLLLSLLQRALTCPRRRSARRPPRRWCTRRPRARR